MTLKLTHSVPKVIQATTRVLRHTPWYMLKVCTSVHACKGSFFSATKYTHTRTYAHHYILGQTTHKHATHTHHATHARTHTHARTRAHTHTHTHKYARTHVYTHHQFHNQQRNPSLFKTTGKVSTFEEGTSSPSPQPAGRSEA